MKEKINIAEILRDKPVNTKLYSPLFSEVFFSHVSGGGIAVGHNGGTSLFFSSGKFYDYDGAEPLLFPSKKMRDWSKFAWKKGDVLTNSSGFKLFFDRWANDDYTRFFGKVNILEDSFSYETEKYTLAAKEETIDTLKIEKSEFKDGDIVALVVRKCTHIAIFQSRQEAYIGFHAVLCQNDELLLEEPFREDVGDIELRLATDSEKQQLFDALEKEGKAWDAEKKQIVDLKPNIDELKPFDKVLVRDSKSSKWRANLFSHKNVNEPYYCVYASWNYCIPYDGNEHLLGTTKDVEN